MNKRFQNLNKKKQATVLWWVRLNLPVQYFSRLNGTWVDDRKPDPQAWPDLCYRLKPREDSE